MRVLSFMLVILMISSCKPTQVRTFKAPKEFLPVIQLVTSRATLNWTFPDSWIEKPIDSFRKASFDIPTKSGSVADFSIVSFPGDVGGILSNVNRWRNQLGLSPISATELDQMKEKINHSFFDIELFDLRSNTEAIIVAVFTFNSEMYFFKTFLKDFSSVDRIKSELIGVLNALEVN